MSKRLDFNKSPEDKATYVEWRRGVFIFYGCIGFVVVGILFAAHFARLALQFAGN